MKTETIIWHNDKELTAAIKYLNPCAAGAENNMLKWEIALNSVGSSLGEVLDSMRSPDPNCPFLILPARD